MARNQKIVLFQIINVNSLINSFATNSEKSISLREIHKTITNYQPSAMTSVDPHIPGNSPSSKKKGKTDDFPNPVAINLVQTTCMQKDRNDGRNGIIKTRQRPTAYKTNQGLVRGPPRRNLSLPCCLHAAIASSPCCPPRQDPSSLLSSLSSLRTNSSCLLLRRYCRRPRPGW